MKPLLKQFGDLTPIDFDNHPVWVSVHVCDTEEDWYDETDEETFRPYTGQLPVDDETMYLVRSEFTLSDGTKFHGFVTPTSSSKSPDNLGTIQPQIFTSDGKRYGFWLGMFPDSEEIQNFYQSIGKTPNQVFPITFKTPVGLVSVISSGTVTRFMSLSDGNFLRIFRRIFNLFRP